MSEILNFMVNVGIVAKIVIAVLFVLSIISWAVIIERGRYFRKIKKETRKFDQIYRMRPEWKELYSYSRGLEYSPFSKVVSSLYEALKNRKSSGALREEPFSLSPAAGTVSVAKKTRSMQTVVDIARTREISRMEKRMIVLSTTVSVSPFLGLLGTVWGIMSAFLSIGVTGSADLASVGPGIAEALITTAAGLAVAIPALIAYNFFVDNIRRMDEQLDIFSLELIGQMEGESAE